MITLKQKLELAKKDEEFRLANSRDRLLGVVVEDLEQDIPKAIKIEKKKIVKPKKLKSEKG
jgi:hypothetical protein